MTTRIAHQFDDATQQFEAARLGIWIFLATEVLFFGGMFTAYAYYRVLYPQAFAEGSRHLNLVLGTINTTLLLTSSFTMVLAVRAAQTGARQHGWTLVGDHRPRRLVSGNQGLRILGQIYRTPRARTGVHAW